MSQIFLTPYIKYSLWLKAKPRKGGGNMFRHQLETLAILLEYGYSEPVLLKAALIHDLVEDGEKVGFRDFDEIIGIDQDGLKVLNLVNEVSRKEFQGVKESKSEFLLRIMNKGSEQAKFLKLADRISNINALLMSRDQEFIDKYISETEQYIIPFAQKIHSGMANELIQQTKLIPIIKIK
jgi:(p)ppGpp synthase/HD superfamily hydrolase